jgi:tetratricopeptide (TPR) repeat protein
VSSGLSDRAAAALAGDDVVELVDVGCDLADVDRHAEALVCFERAVALGDALSWFNVGNTLRDLDRAEEAVDAYEHAVAAGEPAAWLNLGIVLEFLGDLAGAERAYTGAWEGAGQAVGCLNLAHLLDEQDRRPEAEAWLAQAVARGSGRDPSDAEVAALLARWRWERTRDPALEEDLRTGSAVDGDTRAAFAELLLSTGRRTQARAELELGAKLGHTACWLPLGNLLCGDDLDDRSGAVRDEVDEVAAEEAYRAGIAAGDLHCHHNLAMLLLEQGRDAEAEEHLRTGAAGGDALAREVLRDLRDE